MERADDQTCSTLCVQPLCLFDGIFCNGNDRSEVFIMLLDLVKEDIDDVNTSAFLARQELLQL